MINGNWKVAPLAFVIFTVASISILLASEHKALPVDEAPKDASLLQFRNQLLDAVARRDVGFVVKQVTVDIQLSFGGHSGRKRLRRALENGPVDYVTSEIEHRAVSKREGYWDALEQALHMGGQFTHPDVFEAPYTWTFKLPKKSDPFTTYFVTTKNAPLRNRPSKFGTITDTLSYDVVSVIAGENGTRFREIVLASDQQGFVHEDNLRSRLDYRVIMKKTNGKWLITAFIAGD